MTAQIGATRFARLAGAFTACLTLLLGPASVTAAAEPASRSTLRLVLLPSVPPLRPAEAQRSSDIARALAVRTGRVLASERAPDAARHDDAGQVRAQLVAGERLFAQGRLDEAALALDRGIELASREVGLLEGDSTLIRALLARMTIASARSEPVAGAQLARQLLRYSPNPGAEGIAVIPPVRSWIEAQRRALGPRPPLTAGDAGELDRDPLVLFVRRVAGPGLELSLYAAGRLLGGTVLAERSAASVAPAAEAEIVESLARLLPQASAPAPADATLRPGERAPDRPRWRKPTGIALLALGGAALATSIYFAARAYQADAGLYEGCTPSAPCAGATVADRAANRGDQLVGLGVSLGVAVAATVPGLLLLLRRPASARPREVAAARPPFRVLVAGSGLGARFEFP